MHMLRVRSMANVSEFIHFLFISYPLSSKRNVSEEASNVLAASGRARAVRRDALRIALRAHIDCQLGFPGLVECGEALSGVMVPALKFQLLKQMINELVATNFLAFCLAGHYEDTPQTAH